MTAEQIIELFQMKPLPREGGFYAETYRAAERIARSGLPDRYTGPRNLGTAIVYLLTPDTFSALHKGISDELFHFYMGDAVTMLQLHTDGSSEVITLGQQVLKGQRVQTLVPAGSWQGCLLNEGGEFALMGTTVVPGFEFEDYQQGDRARLIEQYPHQRDLITRLIRKA